MALEKRMSSGLLPYDCRFVILARVMSSRLKPAPPDSGFARNKVKLLTGMGIGLCPILLSAVMLSSCASDRKDDSGDLENVTVDYEMAERTIDWLEYIDSGADEESVRRFFFDQVAPTAGCRVIISHWARFMEWDNETFYQFILKALDRTPTDDSLYNDDSSLTRFGQRRALWQAAMKNTDKLRQDIQSLKDMNARERAFKIAKEHLPEDAKLSNQFYVVLFGASSAFSVGERNGFDLLQLPKNPDGSVNTQRTLRTFAHEMHHSGFSYLSERDLGKLGEAGELLLVGLLTAEGMPTWFINKTMEHLDELEQSADPSDRELAADWRRHLGRLPQLYREAESEIKSALGSAEAVKGMFQRWMGGMQGPAYVLGADMMSVIERNLGANQAYALAADFRKLLVTYNRAALKANSEGDSLFVFDQKLAEDIAEFAGAESR